VRSPRTSASRSAAGAPLPRRRSIRSSLSITRLASSMTTKLALELARVCIPLCCLCARTATVPPVRDDSDERPDRGDRDYRHVSTIQHRQKDGEDNRNPETDAAAPLEPPSRGHPAAATRAGEAS